MAPALLPVSAVLAMTASNTICVLVAVVMFWTWIAAGVLMWPPSRPLPLIVTCVVALMRPRVGEILLITGVVLTPPDGVQYKLGQRSCALLVW